VTDAAAFEANFAELLAWYASFGGETVRAADHWRSHSGVPFRALNAVTAIRLAGDAAIADAGVWFAERAMPWRWLLHDSSRPSDLADRLAAAGLELVSDNPAMGLALDGFVAEPPPPGVTIERVVDEPGLRRWQEVHRLALELDPVRDEAWWTAHRRPGFADDAPLVNYLASLDGQPVAAAALFDGAGVAGIYNVATVPEARGRGLGRVVTAEAIAEGVRRGLRWAALGSSPLGFPVYRRLGFVEYGRLRSFSPPA
jgi:ribosomal protein S18 acetylase RimI-like enzyme